ncbi:MAG: chemotaxis-specific protein-glutamate methyltransferase CheB [Ignavibacteriaceae bacterium]
MVRLLIVEDSPVVHELLNYIFSADPDIKIVGTAKDGIEALEKADLIKPDIITMDINMPKMNGLEATKKIMTTNPIPIVIISGRFDTNEVEHTFNAMDAGALAVLSIPPGINHPDFENTAKELISTVKAMAEVKLVRRWPKIDDSSHVNGQKIIELKQKSHEIKLIAIGASTGGPIVLQKILSELHQNFSIPILIVQHMSEGFIQGFVDWLNHTSSIHVQLGRQGEFPLPGHAYVAPDGLYMGIDKNGRIELVNDKPINGLRPTVSYLFRSVANVFGQNAIGILLTGMGADGAEELKLMKEKGAVTIVQDKESSVVFGMPGEAVKIGAETYVLSPNKIASLLNKLTNHINQKDNPF